MLMVMTMGRLNGDIDYNDVIVILLMVTLGIIPRWMMVIYIENVLKVFLN